MCLEYRGIRISEDSDVFPVGVAMCTRAVERYTAKTTQLKLPLSGYSSFRAGEYYEENPHINIHLVFHNLTRFH